MKKIFGIFAALVLLVSCSNGTSHNDDNEAIYVPTVDTTSNNTPAVNNEPASEPVVRANKFVVDNFPMIGIYVDDEGTHNNADWTFSSAYVYDNEYLDGGNSKLMLGASVWYTTDDGRHAVHTGGSVIGTKNGDYYETTFPTGANVRFAFDENNNLYCVENPSFYCVRN